MPTRSARRSRALAGAAGGQTFDATGDPAGVGQVVVDAIGEVVVGG